MRKGRPGEHRNRCVRVHRLCHLADEAAGAGLDPLGAQDERGAADRGFAQHGADMLRRRNHQQRVSAREIGEQAGRANVGRQRHAGQKRHVLVASVDPLDDLGFARPEQHIAAARGDLRQRRAPSTAANDADPHAFTPAPRTASAPGSSGQRARAGVSSGSVRPAAKRSAPAQAIIAALSVHSQSGGATKRRP